jgi:hypothetical protein
MPKNNYGAVVGAVLVTVAVFVLTDLSKFFQSGSPWPTDVDGWLQLVVPSIVVGLLAALTPHYSMSERTTGFRVINTANDAPVLDVNPAPLVVRRPDQPGIVLTPALIASPAKTESTTDPGVPPDISHVGGHSIG